MRDDCPLRRTYLVEREDGGCDLAVLMSSGEVLWERRVALLLDAPWAEVYERAWTAIFVLRRRELRGCEE